MLPKIARLRYKRFRCRAELKEFSILCLLPSYTRLYEPIEQLTSRSAGEGDETRKIQEIPIQVPWRRVAGTSLVKGWSGVWVEHRCPFAEALCLAFMDISTALSASDGMQRAEHDIKDITEPLL